jgi:pilus assembly protein CpaC
MKYNAISFFFAVIISWVFATVPVFAQASIGPRAASVAPAPIEANEAIVVYLSQTEILRLPYQISRIVIADPVVADYRVVSDTELYLVGKTIGRTSLTIWDRNGRTYVMRVDVGIDVSPIADALALSLPDEQGIRVEAAGASVVLSGHVSHAIAADTATRIASGGIAALDRQLLTVDGRPPSGETGDGFLQLINLLKISDPQQVMLEVRIVEVSRDLVERMGVNAQGLGSLGSGSFRLGSSFLSDASGSAGIVISDGPSSFWVDLDAERRNGLVTILAEPTLVAISGTEGSFNVGGKILIPVAQSSSGVAGTSITLEEREFGISLKFIPTVLDNGRINLVVNPEVSELSSVGLSSGSGASLTGLPTFTSTRVSTTVQMRAGETLVIGGLLRNVSARTVRRFPLLGDIPVLGALFRSNEYSRGRTELMIIVRPTLVAPTTEMPNLPTDDIVSPTPFERIFEGLVEGRQLP